MKKRYADVLSSDSSRSWFCVLHNPEKIFGTDKTPEEIVNAAIRVWMLNKPLRSCAVNYEISDNGSPHLHMVLEDPAKTRFSALKKMYGETIHIEETRGTKKEAMAYIRKKPPFEEKEHTVIVPAVIVGDIKAAGANKGNMLYDQIDQYIQEGLTPKQIMRLSSRFSKEEATIRKAYFIKREAETPPRRKVEVVWHVGEGGAGKSETYVELCKKYGEENVYMYADHKVGGFDFYAGEPVLFIDELRAFDYSVLLGLLEGLKKQIHCRFSNAVGLWSIVHITSVYPPEECYKLMVTKEERKRDSLEQLMRRITKVVYHYKEKGEFKSYSMAGIDYVDYEDLIKRALHSCDGEGFYKLEESADTPFEQLELALKANKR